MRGAGKAAAAAGARRGQKGFALVMVLFLLVIISMTTVAFSLRTSGAYRLSRARAMTWQAYYAAKGATEVEKVRLWQRFVATSSPQKGPGGIVSAGEPATSQLGGVDVTVTVVDEAGKFPLNALGNPDEGKRKELTQILERLLGLCGVDNAADAAESIRDYIDKDTDGTRETDALNADIYEVSMLLAARGVEASMLYERHRDDLPAPVELLSTWRDTPNVNVNNATAEVLRAFAPRLTETDATAIIAARLDAPFKSMEDITARVKVSGEALAELGKWAAFNTDTVTLRAEARIGEFARRVETVAWFDSTAAHTIYFRDGWQ